MYSNKNVYLSAFLKLVVIACAALGVCMSAGLGSDRFMGGSTVFMYFTIQSNIAIALVCLWGYLSMAFGRPSTHLGAVIKLVGTVSITLTGIVFCFVLAPTMPESAWSPVNVLTHVVVPIAAVLDFYAVGHAYAYKKHDALWVIVPPLLYAIYAGIGYANGWNFGGGARYPYFFLNWGSKAGAFGFCGELPFMGTGWWILALLLFLLGVGLLYRKTAAMLGRRLHKESK